MKKIEWYINTGFAGCTHEGEFEVEDNATDDEIEKLVKEEVFNYIDWYWSKIPT